MNTPQWRNGKVPTKKHTKLFALIKGFIKVVTTVLLFDNAFMMFFISGIGILPCTAIVIATIIAIIGVWAYE